MSAGRESGRVEAGRILGKVDRAEVKRRMGYHPATETTAPQFEAMRSAFMILANYVVEHTPAGREQALALTALQEALQWSNAAIACNE